MHLVFLLFLLASFTRLCELCVSVSLRGGGLSRDHQLIGRQLIGGHTGQMFTDELSQFHCHPNEAVVRENLWRMFYVYDIIE